MMIDYHVLPSGPFSEVQEPLSLFQDIVLRKGEDVAKKSHRHNVIADQLISAYTENKIVVDINYFLNTELHYFRGQILTDQVLADCLVVGVFAGARDCHSRKEQDDDNK